MKLPTILKDSEPSFPRRSLDKGFTLIEIALVVGLVTIVASVGMFFDFDSFRAHSFYTDRDALISALQHARSEAISNVCRGSCTDGLPHGVNILDDKYIIFQGADYSSADHNQDAVLDANPNVAHGGMDEIVFRQLSGDAVSPGDITLRDNLGGRKSTISINSEGQIIWTDERI
ncbi:MAG: GspH/FimT family pseudopilin [Patescibacteria group bacterium]